MLPVLEVSKFHFLSLCNGFYTIRCLFQFSNLVITILDIVDDGTEWRLRKYKYLLLVPFSDV